MNKKVKDNPAIYMYWDQKRNVLDPKKLSSNSLKYAYWSCPYCQHHWEAKIIDVQLDSYEYLRCCPHCGLGERSIDENESVLQVYPDFRNYINYSVEQDEELDEKLFTLPFNSKRKFNFKCPTCQLSWKDSATNKRLFQLTSGDLFHFGCNETTYHCDYKSVYPNLAKIYSDHLNKFKFNELKLSYNITVPIHWECDKCHCKFELSIDRLLNRIKRSGHYCLECHSSFEELLDKDFDVSPLSFLNSSMLKEWSKRNNITPNQVDVLSNIHVLWECTNCHGEYSCSLFEKTDRSCPFCSNREKLQDFNTLNETHPYLREFWDLSNERDFSEYWFKSDNVVSWVCPCCKINFQCSPAEMVSRTDLENQNFQTCPNQCDWRTEVFKNNIFIKEPKLTKEWSDKNKIPIHLAQTTIETKKYWWDCSKCHGTYLCSIPIRREVSHCCPYCNNEKPLKGYNTFDYLYPELAKLWAPNNKVSIDSFVPLLTEKRFYLWRCKECNFEFHERFSIILNKYLNSETKDLKEMCPFCAELKERQDNISFEDLMNEWDYLNNLILGDPERIPNNTQLRFWWICKNNPEHRYRMAIVDKIANVKRSIEPCMFCKGRRRKREHFVPYRKI